MTTLATQLDAARSALAMRDRVIRQMQDWIDDYRRRIARLEAEVAALRQSKVTQQ